MNKSIYDRVKELRQGDRLQKIIQSTKALPRLKKSTTPPRPLPIPRGFNRNVNTGAPAAKANMVKNIATACGTRKDKKATGVKAMDTKEIEKFIKDKAPKDIVDKLARMQKKPRAELCQLLTKFPEGRKLAFPETVKARLPTPSTPKTENNMFAEAFRAMKDKTETKENIQARAIANYSIEPVTPNTPENKDINTGSPNFINYNNNANVNFKRTGLAQAYIERLKSKRVEEDPLKGTLTKIQKKRFQPKALKGSKKPKTNVYKPDNVLLSLMNFGTGNMRRSTMPSAPVISIRPRLAKSDITRARELSYNKVAELRKTLKKLQNKSRPTRMDKIRIETLNRMLSSNNVQDKFMQQEVNKMVQAKMYNKLLIDMGAKTPPSPKSPPKRSFTMISSSKNKQILKAPKQQKVTMPNASKIERAVYAYEAGKALIKNKPCFSYTKKTLVKIAKVFFPKTEGLERLSKEELCIKIYNKYSKK